MIIYSKPGAATFYKVDLPELLTDYWVPVTEILEAKTIATSTTKAAVFRQVVKYDITSIKKAYNVIVDSARAAVLMAMANNIYQTTFYCNTGTGLYEVTMLIDPSPLGRSNASININFSVIALVS